MAVGVSVATANSILGAMLKGSAYAGHATVFAQMHTADPGAAGTTGVFAFSGGNRATLAIGTVAAGAVDNSAAANFTGASATGTLTHVSLWSASSAGTFIMSLPLLANRVIGNIGDNFTLTQNDVDISIPVAA